jgi:hypothetical protein
MSLKVQSLTGHLGVHFCNDTHGCGDSYVEGIRHKDTAPMIWHRADVGAEDGAADEGASEGEEAQGEGAGESSGQVSPSKPPSVPSEVASFDGSLPDRASGEIGIDDNPNDKSPEALEILTLQEYETKGQSYLDKMMQAALTSNRRTTRYASFNQRYRLRSELRSPLDPDPDETNVMSALLHIQPIADALKIDLRASDWGFRMLTNKGIPEPETGEDSEDSATIVTYGSKAQKAIIVARADSIRNDEIDPTPDSYKLPNSELMFQLLQQQAGDAVSDTKYIIRHAIDQKGTKSVLNAAHDSKGIKPSDMGTWTQTDGAVFRRLLGTRNGRPGAFMTTDHAPDMKCKVVIRLYTWAAIPGDPKNLGAIVEELGPTNDC